VFFKGMNAAELAALTESMMRSSNVIDFSAVPGKKIDKHSTGGVGDKVSICLAPLVAACGVRVPMMSGRGLGHTGGTLDKLSAIPGFSSDIDDRRFVELVETHGFALIGQTSSLAPADKKLYALRDVTATVESMPLICASILSKKMAEGIDGLVLDVKAGSGAFMKSLDDARNLARTMVSVGEKMGRSVRALITSMDQVLGVAVGNASELWEAFDVLKGEGPADLVQLTLELGAAMLLLGGVADSLEDGKTRLMRAIKDGRGLERLRRLIEAQGGDPRALDERTVMPTAQHRFELSSEQAGHVVGFDVEAIGRAGMLLGAGRARIQDSIDTGVGLEVRVRLGDRVEVGQPLFVGLYNDEARRALAEPVLRACVRFGERAEPALPLVRERV
jgi:pyrimidine-nucleoside phosphorylase/thymidine phosphorylase